MYKNINHKKQEITKNYLGLKVEIHFTNNTNVKLYYNLQLHMEFAVDTRRNN